MKFITQTFFILQLCIISSASLASSPEKLDAIKIIIDKDVITLSQFNKRIDQAKANMAAQGQNMDEEALNLEVQDQLIVESLQLQIAERSGINISNQQLGESLNETARRNRLTLAQLKEQIESEGQSYNDFRENTRRQMLIQNVQHGHIRSKVNITDKEVDNYLASPAAKNITEESYDVSFITFPIASNATDKDIEVGKQALNALQKKLVSGQEKFSDYVSGKTLNGVSISGKNLGQRSAADLPSLFVERVTSLSSGEVSSAMRSGAGWHLVKMNRKTGGKQEEYQVHAKHILIKPSAVRSNEQAKKLANDLYTRLSKDEDFGLLAKEYSEDPGSALQGGDLGWSTPNRYVPAFIEALKQLKPGETSQPFQSAFGWHIVFKIEERDHDITLEDQRNQARQVLGQRQYNEALESWLSKIKGEAFIEIKRH